MRDLITKEETKELFEKKIKPLLGPIEKERKRINEQMIQARKKTFVLSAVLVVIGIIFLSLKETISMLPGILGLIVAQECFTFIRLVKPFRTKFKQKIIPQIFTGLIGPCTFNVESHVPKKDFDESHILNKPYNVFHGEDYLEGQFLNMKFKFSEVMAAEVVKKKKGTSTDIKFAGLFFIFYLPFDSKQKTLILHDHNEKIMGKLLGRSIQKQSMRSGYELVQMESVVFEKEYAVYSNDQVQSRVMLKPIVMENLISFKKKYGDSIGISIQGKKLYISIGSSRNHFEPNLHKECISMNEIREIYDIFLLVRDLLDDFQIKTEAA